MSNFDVHCPRCKSFIGSIESEKAPTFQQTADVIHRKRCAHCIEEMCKAAARAPELVASISEKAAKALGLTEEEKAFLQERLAR